VHVILETEDAKIPLFIALEATYAWIYFLTSQQEQLCFHIACLLCSFRASLTITSVLL
jgi:hypothetical protein